MREEIEAWVTQAFQQDAEADAALGSRRGDALPAELARRADRLATREAAMQRLAARAKAAAEGERQRRAEAEAARQRTGQTRRGKAPQEGDERPDDQAQMSCTDAELPIMQRNNQGWEYCGQAPASVDGASQIIVACDVTAAANAKQPAWPMAQWTVAPLEHAGMERPQDATGATQQMPATSDSGSDSEAAAAGVEQWGFDPAMATGRPRHHAPEAAVSEPPTSAKERMAANVRTAAGRAVYARRTVMVEPGFGQSKEARGFRRFWRRGWANMRGAWHLICWTHHLLKIWRYACALITVEADQRGPAGPKRVFVRTHLSSEPPVSRRHGPDGSGQCIRSAWTISLTGDS